MTVFAPAADPIHLRRADNNERFVAFAFSGADLMVETDLDGVITYAVGAFHGIFGQQAETFVGQKLRNLVSPADHDVLDAAVSMLVNRGRLTPMTLRLASAGRNRLALAGLSVPSVNRPARLCLTFARTPSPAASVLRASSPHDFARVTEARLRAEAPCDVGLLEFSYKDDTGLLAGEAVGQALELVAPQAVAGQLAPGRYGLLGNGGTQAELLAAARALEHVLRSKGLEVSIIARHLPLSAEGLTPTQTARALRQALSVFSRDGVEGVEQAGLGNSLAGYLQHAGRKTDALRRAIRGGHFSMAFQPIVSLQTRIVHHHEALIRPRPIPDLPLASPQDFVMLVEAVGLAGELDIAVARLACEQASETGRTVAFNLSGQSVQDSRFRDSLITMLSSTPACKAGLIIVEMTETAEIENVGEASATARALRAIGVPFCLDDFGAGAADMRLLRALTADIVKIDGSYVAGVTESGREHAFVAGMVSIARAVGADVVAERVEIEAEAAALAALGVKYGQGWLFGRPGPLPPSDKQRAGARTGDVASWG